MPAQRELTMRQTRQILRLRHEGVSIREIGCRMAVARSTVQETLKRAARAGLSWPLPEAMNDAVLEQRLFAGAATQLGARRRPEPDWARLALELKRPGVTLTVLWDEYRAVPPEGYAYSRFCDLCRAFE